MFRTLLRLRIPSSVKQLPALWETNSSLIRSAIGETRRVTELRQFSEPKSGDPRPKMDSRYIPPCHCFLFLQEAWAGPKQEANAANYLLSAEGARDRESLRGSTNLGASYLLLEQHLPHKVGPVFPRHHCMTRGHGQVAVLSVSHRLPLAIETQQFKVCELQISGPCFIVLS